MVKKVCQVVFLQETKLGTFVLHTGCCDTAVIGFAN